MELNTILSKIESKEEEIQFKILESLIDEKYGYSSMLEAAVNELDLEFYDDDIYVYARKEGIDKTLTYLLTYIFDCDEDEYNDLASNMMQDICK